MIITHIKGGLGNQMFQYAMGKALALRVNTDLKLDLTWFDQNRNKFQRQYGLHIFSIDVPMATRSEILAFKGTYTHPVLKKMNRLINKYLPLPHKTFVIEKKTRVFNKKMLRLKNNVLLEGYWQSEKYFKDTVAIIRKDFRFSTLPPASFDGMIKKINNSNSVCIHFRRGDYYNNKNTRKIFGTCGIGYYGRAVRCIASMISHPVLFIFSNDVDWVKNNFKTDFPMHFMYPVSQESAYHDLYVMSLCKHFIIANSSFSWWGAWLSEHKNKIVIVPRKWNNRGEKANKDRHPDEWIQL